MHVSISIATLVLWRVLLAADATVFTDRGTLPNIREIIVGRCIEYQNGLVLNYTHDGMEELRAKNCTKIVDYFFKSFAHQDPCNVSMDNYEAFLQEAKTTIPRNMATYWDGWDIYQIVTNYANKGQRSVTLETTLPGYLGNGISFCGSKSESSGLEYKNCPGEGDCGFGKGAVDAFWSKLSTYFGAEGAGDVKVFFNSNRPGGAFQENGSFFYEFEVLNLNATRINHMDIFVVTELNKARGDSCGSPSLLRLGHILDERRISHTCHEQPQAVLHVLCADEPNHVDCQFQARVTNALSSGSPQTIYRNYFYSLILLFTYLTLLHES